MAPEQQLTFGPFQLDVTDGRLWRGAQVVALRPRAVAVLRYLVEHPGRLVTKAELRRHVWGSTHVTDTVLRVCVREIRAALGDAASAPQYVADGGPGGVSLSRRGRAGSPCPADARPPRGPPARSRAPGGVVRARGQRPAPAGLRQR